MIMPEKLRGKTGSVSIRALLQQGIRHCLGLVADHAGLPGRQPPVRDDELFQVLRPQLEGQVFLRVRRGVGRGLLLIAQAEGGQDASDEGGGPAADVSVRDQQQLIQKVQGLLLLRGVPASCCKKH